MAKIVIELTYEDVATTKGETRYAVEDAIYKKVLETLKVDEKKFILHIQKMTSYDEWSVRVVEVEYELIPIISTEQQKEFTTSCEDETETRSE